MFLFGDIRRAFHFTLAIHPLPSAFGGTYPPPHPRPRPNKTTIILKYQNNTLLTYTLQDLPQIAETLLATHGRHAVYALTGELGAGKTTLVAEMARQLGVTEPTSSPTFSIVNEYAGADGPVYHLDCYRLKSVEEALDAGLEELFEARGHAVFVEWPAVIEPLLPADVVRLRLEHAADGGRRLSVHPPTTQP